MPSESDTELVRVGELAAHLGLPVYTVRRMADAGKIPSVRTRGGHRLFDPTAVRAALGTPSGTIGVSSTDFGAAPIEPSAAPIWARQFVLDQQLEEHVVWQQLNDVLALAEDSAAGMVLRYAISEMVNNAIDHSHGSTVTVTVWVDTENLTFRIADNGEGVFAHLRRGLNLADDFESIGSLTKGKQTTAPDHHSGEGIFFTSKALDVFRLAANGKRWTVDNLRADQAVGVSDVVQGSEVIGQIDRQTKRSTRDVFLAYSENFEFVRTRPVVKLFGFGQRFVSRSEARRLLDGLDNFTEIDIDFTGVVDVGQGFVDELLRVWPQHHAGKRIHPINMNEAVEFMVRRGLPQ